MPEQYRTIDKAFTAELDGLLRREKYDEVVAIIATTSPVTVTLAEAEWATIIAALRFGGTEVMAAVHNKLTSQVNAQSSTPGDEYGPA